MGFEYIYHVMVFLKTGLIFQIEMLELSWKFLVLIVNFFEFQKRQKKFLKKRQKLFRKKTKKSLSWMV